MISLKRSMEVLDEKEARLAAWLDEYTGLLGALESAADVLAGKDGLPFRKQMKEVRLQLVPEVVAKAIKQNGEKVEKDLDRFARQVAEVTERKEWEYKQIIRIVAEAGATMIRSGSSQSEELRQFATKIGSVSCLESVGELRKQLTSRVAELKEIADRIQEDGQARARVLENNLRKVQEKLNVAETLAETDALTGLGNRRMAENTMRTAISSGAPFSLIVLDLDGFKSVNDHYGHPQGDELLKAIALQIKESVRESDVLCRWGGDEFVVLLANTPLAGAEQRAAQIQANAFGQFVLGHAGKSIVVNITASAGTAQHHPGESPSELFERADRILYERKSQRRARLPQVASRS